MHHVNDVHQNPIDDALCYSNDPDTDNERKLRQPLTAYIQCLVRHPLRGRPGPLTEIYH